MNKIKLLALAMLGLGSFNFIANAIPENFSVFDFGAKRLIVVGDLHTAHTNNVRLEGPYIKINENCCAEIAKASKASCYLIEGIPKKIYEHYVKEELNYKDSIGSLNYFSYKNNLRLGNLKFESISIPEDESRLQAIRECVGFLLLLIKRNSSIAVSRATIAHVNKICASYVSCTLQDFTNEAKNLLDIEKGMINNFLPDQKLFILKLQKILMDKITEFESQINKFACHVDPKLSTLPIGVALFKLTQIPDYTNEIFFDLHDDYIIPIIGGLGDFRCIIKVLEFLNNYNLVVAHVGANHATCLREFFNLDNRFKERISVGNFALDSEDFHPLQAEIYRDLCYEWIIKELCTPAGSGEVKAGGEAAQAAAGLRPAAPMSAALAGAPRSAVPVKAAPAKMAASAAATSAPSAADGKEAIESRGAAAPSTAIVGGVTGEAIAKICPACGKSGNRRCSRCKKVYYCSTECQAAHWPVHKPTCTAAKIK